MLFTPWLDTFRTRPARAVVKQGPALKRRRPKGHRPALIELLETRLVLTPPQFVSVSPNVGTFLQDGDVRTEAPRELVFQFSPGQTLDPATVGAIHVVGAGHDGGFRPANVVTDLGTNGQVVLRIGAQRLGSGENGNTLTVLAADLGGLGPTIASDVQGNLTLTLDSNVANPTTAQKLIDFAGNNSVARQLLTVSLISGNPATDLSTILTQVAPLIGAGAASALSSFGAGPSLNVLFTANQPGEAGNGISLQVNRLDLGNNPLTNRAPRINVFGNRIEVVVNENPSAVTRAQDLISALNTHNQASRLLTASLATGVGTTSVAGITDGSQITLSGADRVLVASATSGFQTGTNLRVQFDARAQGISGNSISLLFNRANLGALSAAPTVSVATTVNGTVISVTLNTNSAARTTAADLVTALAGNVLANNLISAKVVSGSGSTDITTISTSPAVQLGGADPAVSPGFRGLLPSQREVVYRFGTSLTDDAYRIEVIGTGAAPLTNTGGEIVDNGQDTFRTITLDLGAVVTGVVPQPVLRQQLILVNDVSKITDGDTLTVDPGTGTSLFTFEFNNTAVQAPGTVRAGGNLAIDFNKTTATPSDVAQAIRDAINNATLASPDVTATATGGTVGVVGGAYDVRVKLTLSDSTALTQRAGGIVQRRDLVNVFFNTDNLDGTLAQDIRFYQLVDTKGTVNPDDDSILMPSSVVYDAARETSTLVFPTDLPTATYKLMVGRSDESNDLLTNAVNVGAIFSSSPYSRVGFIGDTGGDGDYDLYRFEVQPGSTISVTIQPDAGVDTLPRLFMADGTELGASVVNGAPGAPDQLSFNALAGGTFFLGVSNSVNNGYNPVDGSGRIAGGTTGSYQLAIASNFGMSTSDDNSSYATATNLGVLGAGGQSFFSQIQPQSVPLPPPAGGPDEPGHREIPAESHGVGPGTTPSVPGTLGTVTFSFPTVYGVDAQGGTLLNQITPAQKERTREIFEMYGSLYGFEVAESTAGGIGVVTGDPRVLLPPGAPPGAVGGIAGGGLVIMNALLNFTAQDDQFNGSWMGIALHEIGHAVGLLHSYDIRSVQGNGTQGEDEFPGHNDIVHGRRISPNSGTDIDLYQFNVETTGTFTAEIVAERLASSSLLNSAMKLYKQNADGSRSLVAQNDDYYSNDAFVSLMLDPGTYFLGVSSTGNTDYDPAVSDSGFYGTSNGAYQLNLGFSTRASSALLDTTGQRLDGNADGTQGGAFEFAFRSDNTLLVDKNVITNLTASMNSVTNTVSVRDVLVFPSTPGFQIRIDNEVMTVTAINTTGNTLTVLRAQSGTTAASHSAGRAVRPAASNGSAANPYGLISSAVSAATPGTIIRIVGNGGTDNDILTINDNRPYLLGFNDSFAALEDGSKFEIPQDVVVQFDAGTVVKSQSAVIDAGTSAVGITRSGSAIQVLGTPRQDVYFTTYENDLIGGDSDGVTDGANAGDWGGLVFRSDSDFQASDAATNPRDPGIFLNQVYHANLSFGGGQVFVDSVQSVFAPIHLISARPTIAYSTITNSAASAISANPDSFDDGRNRIGPEFNGNLVTGNTFNGVLLRVETQLGQTIDRLTTTARFDDTDLVHLIPTNLEIVGNPGGPLNGSPRPSGRLAVDPGMVVKLGASRIEGMRGNSHLIAEGTAQNPVVLTSLNDDRYGSGGTFDSTGNQQTTVANPGDWGGLAFNANSRLSVSHAYIAYAGGNTPIEGTSDNFNTVEIHHGVKARIADSTFENNAGGGGGSRNGRGSTTQSTIFVRQAQPIILNNLFRNNVGNVIDINANAMLSTFQRDTGRSTGVINDYEQFADNHGPLVRMNRMSGNSTNGMNIRPDTLTTESVWDDTDIVHVLRGEIIVDQHHTYSGLRLVSNPGESLVVKLQGANAGFTADGILLDIEDRIGGTVQVIGRPGFPVVLTSLSDDTVGASLDQNGFPQTDTNNNGPSTGAPGNWRSLRFNKNSNDRNVRVSLETEDANNGAIELNDNPGNAQFLGELAPQHVTGPNASNVAEIDTNVRADGDDNRPVGFEVHGFISADDPGDVDLYSFRATAGNQIWIDLDRTRGGALDPVIELIQADGTVLARARYDHTTLSVDIDDFTAATNDVNGLIEHDYLGGDFYTFNPYDTGFRIFLPGNAGTVGTYFVRVRSNQATEADLTNTADGGLTSGEYQLQIRTQQVDEKPGSVVRYADIRFAQTGIEAFGLPAHSPLLSESIETTQANGPNQTHQPLGNLLDSDRNVLTTGGTLSVGDDIDFYRFNSDYARTILGDSIQVIGGVNAPPPGSPAGAGPKTWTAVFDVDYADGLTRGDTTLVVYDANGVPILVGRESNIQDDRPATGNANDLDDLTRGSVGFLDPFIGPVQLPTGIPGATSNYSYAVSSNSQLNRQLNQTYQTTATNAFTRLEPVNSVTRVIEDHISFQGYASNGAQVDPLHTNGLFDITDTQTLRANVRTFDLGDVPLFISGTNTLTAVNPLFGYTINSINTNQGVGNNAVQDIVMRSDGVLYGYQNLFNTVNNVGRLFTLNSGTGAITAIGGGDGIQGESPTPQQFGPGGTGNTNDFDDITVSNNVGAITIERTGLSGGNPTYIGWVAVHENGRTATGANSVNSKLYRIDLATGAVANGPNDSGFGDIQFNGVGYASGNASIFDTGGSSTFHVQARAPGVAGNGITLDLQSSGVNNGGISINTNFGTGTITVTAGQGASAQSIADAINSNGSAGQLVTVTVRAGDAGGRTTGTSGGGFFDATLTGGQDAMVNGAPQTLKGNVTGLAFNTLTPNNIGSNFLYGITDQGQFISIERLDPDTRDLEAAATLIYDFNPANPNGDPLGIGAQLANLDFRGLALGPQNLHPDAAGLGRFSDTFFALNSAGELVAFRLNATTGIEPVLAFGSDNDIQALTASATPQAGDTFTLTFISDTYGALTTRDIDATSTADVRAALLELRQLDRLSDRMDGVSTRNNVPIFTGADLNITGSLAGGDLEIEFQGFYQDKVVPTLIVDDAGMVVSGATITVSNPTVDTIATTTASFAGGTAEVIYTANTPGAAGAGITVTVREDDLGPGTLPTVNVAGQTITVTLNRNPGFESTVQDLVDAINGNGPASALITPSITFGPGQVAASTVNTFATATETYALGLNSVTLTYTATTAGIAGDGVQINVVAADLGGGAALPTVMVSGGNVITVTLDNDAANAGASASTAFELRNAINGDLAASALVTAAVTAGNGNLRPTALFGLPSFATTAGNYQQPINSATTTGQFTPQVGGDGIRDTAFRGGLPANSTGLAFSPLDFNLWHPTIRRGDIDVAGHGINPAYDQSRTPDDEDVSYTDQAGHSYTLNQDQGGISFYFGLEQYVDGETSPYLNYAQLAGNTRTQLGILDNDFQRDLTSNTNIRNNYNLPGGALGSLLTAPFDLVSDTGTETGRDRPTLYLNYFLQSQDDSAGDPDGSFNDAARVLLSSDGGRTWQLLATNNAPRDADSELPHFNSHSRLANNTDARQRIQELFDNSGTWRQARVDLSDFVGMSGLRLRVDFSTAGTIIGGAPQTNDSDLASPVDAFGDLTNDPNAFTRGQNNDSEGFYIDDIIIGWSERGEMITAATADQGYFQVPQPPMALMLPQEILTGDYQVEIRRGFQYAGNASPTAPEIVVAQTFDPNIRHIPGVTGVFSPTTGLQLPQTLTDLFSTPVTDDFDFGDSDPTTFGFDPVVGWIPNGAGSNAPWVVLPTQDSGPTTTSNSTFDGTTLNGFFFVADDSIFPAGQFIFFVDDEPMGGQVVLPNTIAYVRQAATAVPHNIGAPVANGTFAARSGPIGANETTVMQVTVTSSRFDFDYKLLADSGDFFQIFVDEIGSEGGPAFQTGTSTNGQFVSQTITLSPGTHTIFFVYTKDGNDTLGIADAMEGVFLDNVVFQGLSGVFIRGDRNIERQQGHFQIENNIIRDVSNHGIDVAAGPRSAVGRFPTPGSPINFDQNNAERLAPGVTIANNLITGFGSVGVRFGGDPTSPGTATDPESAVPFGKIINNTIYGAVAPAGTGVLIHDYASPTLLNNIIANTTTGISIDGFSSGLASPPVVNRTFFHGNTANTAGIVNNQNAIPDPVSNPLFVNVATRNFYLAPGSQAIDRSLGTLADRSNFVAVKAQSGIPNSDTVSPTRDIFGQLRVDDASQPPSGLGGEVFFDLGAIERADFEGGIASLIVPEDNGTEDRDPLPTVVQIDSPGFFNQFVVKLTDNGIGIDDATVNTSQFVLTLTTRTGTVTLVDGVDYVFTYNANTNEAVLTSVTLFPQDARYSLSIDNSAATGVLDFAGNPLGPNQGDGSLRFDILVTNGPNDPPVNTVPAGPTINENTVAAPVSVTFSAADSNAISVDDPDAFISTNQLQVTLTATNGSISLPANFASLVTLNVGTGTNDPVVTFTGTISNINQMLAGGTLAADKLTFTPALNYNSTLVGSLGPCRLTVTTSDLGNFSADVPLVVQTDTDNIDFTVNPINSTPGVVTPATAMTDEDVNLTFSGNVSVNDLADGNLGIVQATLSITNGTGTLFLSGITGLNFAFTPDANGSPAGDGMDDVTMRFRGTLTDINAALNGLIYDPAQDFNGTATLTVAINDLGNTGPGGSLTAMGSTLITINARNDNPVNLFNGSSTFPGAAQAALERTPYVFNAGNSNQLSVNDVDVLDDATFPGVLVITLTSTTSTTATPTGSLTLGSVTGITFDAGADSTSSMTIRGHITDLRNALDGLTFNPDATFTTAVAGEFARITITTTDEGRTGAGPTVPDTDFVDLDVQEVNDPPTVAVPGNQTAAEDGSLTFSVAGLNPIVIGDDPVFDPVPGPGDIFQVTLTVANGVLSLNPAIIASLDFAFAPDADGSPAGDGTDDATMTFRGSVANINAALDGLVYEPNLNFNSFFGTTDTLSVTVNDRGHSGQGGSKTAGDSVTLTVDPRNDTPAVAAPTNANAVEDTDVGSPLVLRFSSANSNQIRVTDPQDDATQAGTGLYQVTLAVTSSGAVGSVTLNQLTGLAFSSGDGDHDSTMTFTGTLANINAALDGLYFTPPPGENAPNQTLTITLNDQGNIDNSGSPPNLSANAVVNIVVDGDNDAPVITKPANFSLTEDTLAVFNAANSRLITFADIDDNGGDLTLIVTVTNGTATAGSMPGGLTSFTPQANGFQAVGSESELNAVLNGLTVDPTDNFVGIVTLTVRVEDNGNTGVAPSPNLNDQESIQITYTAQNDAPTVNAQLSPIAVNEDGSVVLSTANGNGISIDDVDLGSGQARVTLTVTKGTLTLSQFTGLIFTAPADGTNDATMTFVGTSKSAINAALDGMIYRPNPAVNGSDTLTITVNDQGNSGPGGPMQVTVNVPINIAAVNDAPALTVPGAQFVGEDGVKVFSTATSNAILASDIDVNEGTGQVEVALSVTSGTLTLGSTNNITIFSGANGSAAVTIRGPLNDVNIAMNGLAYRPGQDYSGGDLLSVALSDLGNTGAGNVLTANGSVAITVTAVNDAPVNTVPTVSPSVVEDNTLLLNGANTISVADVDAGTNPIRVTLTVTNGTLTMGTLTGLSFMTGDGTADPSMTFTGTLANINTALASLSFRPTDNFNGSALLSVTSNDQGNSGSGSPQSDLDSFQITVTADNDAPVGVNDAYSVVRGGTLTTTDVNGSDSNPNNNGVLANDTDIDGPSISASLVDSPTNASAFNLNGDGTFTYTHNGSANLSDSFTYRAFDGTANSQLVTVTISVNDPPVITNAGTVSINENLSNGSSVADINATDGNGHTVTFAIIGGNTGNAFTINPNTGVVTVASSAALNFESTPTFTLTIQATDNAATPASTTDTLTVNLNDQAEAVTIGSNIWANTNNQGMTLVLDGTGTRLRVLISGTDTEIFEQHVLANITNLSVVARNNASDALTLDYSNGNPYPASGVTFNGGTGTGSDSLILTNGTTFDSITHTFTSASSGSVALTLGVSTSTVSYSNLEPITDNLSATNRTFTYNGVADSVTISDSGLAGDGISRITSPGTAEEVDFRVPTNALVVQLGGGNDTLSGVSIDDAFAGLLTIRGEAGNDSIDMIGFDVAVSLDGGTGNDSLLSGLGNDTIIGFDGDDLLDGREGNDILLGSAGTDTLTGGAGSNSLNGNGPSTDVVREFVTGIVTLSTAGLTWSNGSNTLANIESASLIGGAGNDTINLSGWTLPGAVTVQAGPGNDSITGSATRDIIDGQEDNDSILGGDSQDVLTGGSGADFLLGDNGDDLLDGGIGNDTLLGAAGNDTLTGGAGTDFIDGQGSSNDMLSETVAGQVTLTNSSLNVGGEIDTVNRVEIAMLLGSSGHDRIDTRNWSGITTISSGSGNDTILAGAGFDRVFAGDGDDQVSLGGSSDIAYGEAGNDTIDGGDGDDYILGNDGHDAIRGGNGNDKLFGDLGNDTIIGSAGNDSVMGREGNDSLAGESGVDTVKGDAGADKLAGGGNGFPRESGDVISAESFSEIDEAFSYTFPLIM